mmetsp:Transcript_14297/g.19351  ORF Transcript_14297/g.19351 Transcript_14297/m.19351 type:complete len:93 (-) Transcript_14297:1877-2155(-)|eukprot:scaffold237310_cov28-Tisochrysis_lutea.AAC.1
MKLNKKTIADVDVVGKRVLSEHAARCLARSSFSLLEPEFPAGGSTSTLTHQHLSFFLVLSTVLHCLALLPISQPRTSYDPIPTHRSPPGARQ